MIEIERKFLVNEKFSNLDLKKLDCLDIRQWYISYDPTVRVRLSNNEAFLTIKGKGDIAKLEVENKIPQAHAFALLGLKRDSEIVKKRYLFPFQGYVWEIDVFEGDNTGLVVAEIELDCEAELFPIPDFIDREVSSDKSYSNAALAKKARRS